MSDPLAGKYRKSCKDEFRMAELILKDCGGSLAWSENDYEAFRFTSPAATLIFYPHKVGGTGNVHIRVRDQASRDKEKAQELILLLNIGSGHNCTFHQKHNWKFAPQIELADKLGLKFGWAAEQLRGTP